MADAARWAAAKFKAVTDSAKPGQRQTIHNARDSGEEAGEKDKTIRAL
jgi:hypothetical protein